MGTARLLARLALTCVMGGRPAIPNRPSFSLLHLLRTILGVAHATYYFPIIARGRSVSAWVVRGLAYRFLLLPASLPVLRNADPISASVPTAESAKTHHG